MFRVEDYLGYYDVISCVKIFKKTPLQVIEYFTRVFNSPRGGFM